MQVGSLVEVVSDFSEIKREWPFISYPNKGDILTIKSIMLHPRSQMRRLGAVMLTFEELDNPYGISDRKIDNTPNFIELQPPMSIEIEDLLVYKDTI